MTLAIEPVLCLKDNYVWLLREPQSGNVAGVDPSEAAPVKAKLEKDARQVVEPGTACFWTEGDAIALPYGRTPISTDERPKLASRCNVLGKIVGDPKRLVAVEGGETLTVERV